MLEDIEFLILSNIICLLIGITSTVLLIQPNLQQCEANLENREAIINELLKEYTYKHKELTK